MKESDINKVLETANHMRRTASNNGVVTVMLPTAAVGKALDYHQNEAPIYPHGKRLDMIKLLTRRLEIYEYQIKNTRTCREVNKAGFLAMLGQFISTGHMVDEDGFKRINELLDHNAQPLLDLVIAGQPMLTILMDAIKPVSKSSEGK